MLFTTEGRPVLGRSEGLIFFRIGSKKFDIVRKKYNGFETARTGSIGFGWYRLCSTGTVENEKSFFIE